MVTEAQLTAAEQAAKDYVLNCILNGLSLSEPCDESFKDEDFRLPDWYDDEKYRRGQKYFLDNRSGVMLSNLYGLFSLICEPNGAKILDRTGMSSEPSTAKKRYVSTTVHMLSWFQVELTPGSKSWESLKRVRKMHLIASKSALKNKVGFIPQCSMAMTQFGFMGYALVRPHMLGIKHDNVEDREAFVHLWAVLGYMLGIKDVFNMCLHPLEVVETICRIFIRYAFIPFLQMETPTFKKLGKAFIEGMSFFIPFSSYESRLFLARRLAGIPGYQYKADMSKEVFQRQIFSPHELQQFREQFQNCPGHEYRRNMVFDEKMHLLVVNVGQSESFSSYKGSENNFDNNNNDQCEKDKLTSTLANIMELENDNELTITELEEGNMEKYLNDSRFHELSSKDQLLVNTGLNHAKMIENRFTRPLYEAMLSFYIFLMNKYHESNK